MISTKSRMNSDDPGSSHVARFMVMYLNIMCSSVVALVYSHTNAEPFGHSFKVVCKAIALTCMINVNIEINPCCCIAMQMQAGTQGSLACPYVTLSMYWPASADVMHSFKHFLHLGEKAEKLYMVLKIEGVKPLLFQIFMLLIGNA